MWFNHFIDSPQCNLNLCRKSLSQVEQATAIQPISCEKEQALTDLFYSGILKVFFYPWIHVKFQKMLAKKYLKTCLKFLSVISIDITQMSVRIWPSVMRLANFKHHKVYYFSDEIWLRRIRILLPKYNLYHSVSHHFYTVFNLFDKTHTKTRLRTGLAW